jgi:nucleotide-binding universal stress UspA family protein
MTYRVLLVPQFGDSVEANALDLAQGLAQRFRSHICGLHVRWPIDMPIGGMMEPALVTPGLVDELERAAGERARAARERFDAWRQRHAIPTAASPARTDQASCEWREQEGAIDVAVAAAGRVADLVVLGREARTPDHASDLALEGALFHSGRPVLVVPGPSALPETVLLAWNDSAQAVRAVAAAEPLLAAARKIVVFVAAEHGREAFAVDALTAWLGWRGLGAPTIVSASEGDPAVRLLEAAEQHKAGLVVMGAYTHSRLRHLVFGGVTTHMLRHSSIPLLMAH